MIHMIQELFGRTLKKCGGSEEAIAIPPVARATRSAAEAENAFVIAIELAAIFRTDSG
jgi:hypothetical protein